MYILYSATIARIYQAKTTFKNQDGDFKIFKAVSEIL